MKAGTIVENLRAGFETYFVYEKAKHGSFNRSDEISVGYNITRLGKDWLMQRACYSSESVSNQELFPRVGYIDLAQLTLENVLEVIGRSDE